MLTFLKSPKFQARGGGYTQRRDIFCSAKIQDRLRQRLVDIQMASFKKDQRALQVSCDPQQWILPGFGQLKKLFRRA